MQQHAQFLSHISSKFFHGNTTQTQNPPLLGEFGEQILFNVQQKNKLGEFDKKREENYNEQ